MGAVKQALMSAVENLVDEIESNGDLSATVRDLIGDSDAEQRDSRFWRILQTVYRLSRESYVANSHGWLEPTDTTRQFELLRDHIIAEPHMMAELIGQECRYRKDDS